MKALIGKKIGMTTITAENGTTQAVTIVNVADHHILRHKTTEVDGYKALVVGTQKAKKLAKPQAQEFKKLKLMPKFIKEIRVDEISEEQNVGSIYKSDIFNIGDEVSVTGLTKGKGWAGTIRRHNFHRGRKTHGGRSYRRPGSIGSMFPQKIFKGKKMAGQLGHKQQTISGLKISLVDVEQGIIGVSGAIPGPKKGIVLIKG